MRLTSFFRPLTAVAAPALLALAVHACGEVLQPEDVLVVPAVFNAVSGAAITADANGSVQGAGLVRVVDKEGVGIPGLTVTFAASKGTLTGGTVTTDAQGEAAVETWNVGTVAGAATLTATLVGQPPGITLAPVVFNATINAGPAAAAIVAPPATSNNQAGAAGSALPIPPAVQVNDQYGNPKAGVVVTFQIMTGGGTLNNSTATTATVTTLSTGIATLAAWTLGTVTGTNTLRATAAGVTAPVNFSAASNAGPAAKIVIAPGSSASQGQTAPAGSNVAVAPAVLVTDQFDNAVPAGTGVLFTVATGGGKVLANAADATGANSLTASTNSSGIATIYGWKLGAPGSNTLRVTIPSVSAVPAFTFTATSTPGAPTQIAINAGNNQSAAISTAVAIAPSVIVRDQLNYPVPGVSVTFLPASGNGSVTGSPAITNANGIATVGSWTLGPTLGSQTLSATVTGSVPTITVSFTATATDQCDTGKPYTLGTVIAASLASTDCRGSSGTSWNADYYSFTTTNTTTQILLTQTPSGFDGVVYSYLWPGGGWGWTASSAQPVNTYMAVAAGSYVFEATSFVAGTTGSYQISSTVNPALPSGCLGMLLSRGISVTHVMDLGCNAAPASRSGPTAATKEYIVYVPANTFMTVRMNAGTLLDPYLECFDVTNGIPSATYIPGCFNDDSGGGVNALMNTPISSSGRYIVIRATHFLPTTGGSPTTGTYTLSIDP